MKAYLYLLSFLTIVLFFKEVKLRVEKKTDLDLGGHFNPKRNFFFEKCSKCGKRLKHYHWFWGKGDFMAADVDYLGKTEWYCENCDAEMSKNVLHKIPHN